MMPRRQVFVRGVGAVTALGATWPQSFKALAEGQCAIRPVAGFDATNFPSTVCAAIKGYTHTPDRRWALTKAAAYEAVQSSGMKGWSPPNQKLGIFLGVESGRAPFTTVHALTKAAGGAAIFDHRQFGIQARKYAAQFDDSIISPAAVASALAKEYAAGGPVLTVSLACASSAVAIAEAARAIRLGDCDAAICGGVGADIDPLMLAGFGRLGALSARGVSCPFDMRRDGFVVGEGAAVVVLSHQAGHAAVELAGEGRSLDAYHLTAPDPHGSGALRAMQAAMHMAQTQGLDYVQAHGTSTPLNDAIEAAALQRLLGSHLAQTHVSSVKGALGHWIAGAGALGFLCAYSAIVEGAVLPTANLRKPDPDCALPHVMEHALAKEVHTALVNAFAFGGANCSLVLRRCA